MNDLVTPLQSAWAKAECEARDAEWEDASNANALRVKADRMKERLDNGELYEVAF
ncbi:MAG: hypothetical protein GOVbin631_41 [Prokaryotic dsDNA virus sp.]|nr:MAG: hypothetical protein GOVbin631_41 [Prokaryotic dsDNA virus sp.]|tara:strand:- start:86 stop:250 length:165 start_codon:yes stop_codon:yes gene_type:complete